MSRADNAQKFTKRWVASRKATVMNAVLFWSISLDEAFNLYVL
jgi:hypothetical protein